MSEMMQMELKEFAQQADAWFKENKPAEPDFMLPLTFMEVGTQEQFEFLQGWQNKVYEAGYLGAAWPSEYGGGGLAQEFQDVATKMMRKHQVPIMINAIGINWTGPLLLDIGTEEHKRRYLKGILSADDIWCQGFSEPENGSDLGNAQLRAVKDGDHYLLNGSKIWTTQGNFAKYMILLARTNPEARNKYAGLSFFLAPMNIDGVETHPIRKLTGEYGFTQTFFTDARIPADGLMGAEGEGWKIAMRVLEYERGARKGQAGGYVITPMDLYAILDFAKRIKQGGRPVIDDPVLRDELTEFLIEIQGLELSNQRLKYQELNQDYPFGLELSSKLRFTEFARRVSEFALKLQGQQGAYYVDEPQAVDQGLWQRSYLNAFSATIGGGTSEIQHNIIGEHVLGLPKR